MNSSPNRLFSITSTLLMVFTLMLSGCGETLTDTEYVARAKDSLDKGDINAGVIELKNALNVNPGNVEARWLLGKTYIESGEPAGALKELQKAEELGIERSAILLPLAHTLIMIHAYQKVLDEFRPVPGISTEDVAELTALHGHAYMGLGELDKATTAYEEARSINPEEAEAWYGLAQVAIFQDEWDAARSHLDRAVELYPRFANAWSLSGDLAKRQGDLEKAEADYSKAIASRFYNLNDHYKRGLVRVQRQEYGAAKQDIAAIRKRAKRSADADYLQGLIHQQQGPTAEAQTSFESALSIDPDYMPAVYQLGVIHFQAQNNALARTHLEKYSASNPGYIPVRQLLATLDLREGVFASARDRLMPILKQQPENVVALKLMASIAMRQGESEEAIGYLRKLNELEAGTAQASMNLGLGLIAEGKSDEGVEQLQKALELDADLKMADFGLVMNQLKQGRLEDALAAARDFTERQPGSPMAWNLLGYVQLQGKQIEAARESFRRALEIRSGDPGAANNLASLALLEGDADEAIRQYESILKYHPDHIRTVVKLGKLLVDRERIDDAEALYAAKVEAYPEAIDPRVLLAEIHVQRGEPAKALTLLQVVPETFLEHPAYLAMLGKAQLAAGQNANAIRSLEQLKKVRPRYLPAYTMLAEAYANQGDLEKLEATLDTALAIQPGNLMALLGKLKLFVQQKRTTEASELLTSLKTGYPELPEIYIQQARLAQVEGQPQAAVQAYAEAFRRAPGTELVSDLALAQWKAGQPEAGIKTLNDWLSAHPDDLVVRYNLANLCMATGRNEESRAAFTAVVEARPKHTLALTNLALLSRQTDPDKAYEYARRAFDVAPDAPFVQDALAQVHLDRGEVMLALRLLEQAVERAPGNLQIRFHWAQAMARNGEKEKAASELTRILDKGRRFAGEPAARDLLRQLSSGPG